MRILVAGGQGQLGRSLQSRGGAHDLIALDLEALDICDAAQVQRALAAHQPDVMINAAAYTAVDKAESEPDRAFAVNRDGAGILAEACKERGVQFLHVSTDYVFDGTSVAPYREDDPIAPLGVYGQSKAEGEQRVAAAGGTIVRTSWLFAEGGPSFVHTMLRLAKERPVLRVVADQHGCPTYAGDLAEALLTLAGRAHLERVYHYCNDGATTWHAFATATLAIARERGIPLACDRVEAITTADYPTPARRPLNAVLDTGRIRSLGIAPPPWTLGLARVVDHAHSEK